MDPDAFSWLLGDPGQALLRDATRLFAEDRDPDLIRIAEALRRDADPVHVSTAMTQVRLRDQAKPKFGAEAAVMYFTPDGLEQATGARVAAHRAARVAAAAPDSVLDLGCGIGGDLVAFARAGLTTAGVDREETRVAVASANLAALGLGGAAQVADGTSIDLSPFGVVFADPDRRGPRGRVFDAHSYAPPWPFVAQLLERASCVKVAPGIPHDLLPADVEAEWVSDGGQVKEAVLWSSALALTGRRATVIGPTGLATLTDEDLPDVPPVRDVGRFLYEPDGAVIRAGLVTAVASLVGGGLVDRHIAYVTADRPTSTPFARGYEVLDRLPFHEKPLRAALHARDIGRLTIKKRGVDVVPDRLRKRLALRGDEEATVVLTRVLGRGTALLVRRI